MSEGTFAGRLYVDIESNTSGFGSTLQQKINAETARVKADIKARLDAARVEAQLRAIAARDHKVELTTQLNSARTEAALDTITKKQRIAEIRAQAEKAKAEADLDATANKRRVTEIKAQVDTAKANADLNMVTVRERVARIKAEADVAEAEARIAAAAAKKRKVELQAEADTTKANAQLAAATRPRTVTINANLNQLTSGLSRATGMLGPLLKFPVIAAGISMAAGAAAQLAAGLFSVVAAASSAVGVLGALPGLVAGAAQGIGAVITGFSGIGGAIKAAASADKAGASTAASAASAREAAAKRVLDAQERVTDAARTLSRTQVSAYETVRDAAGALAAAQESAAQRVAAAQQRVADVIRSTSRSVESAQRALADVTQAAARRVASAQESLASAQESAARRIASAERSVAAAKRDAVAAELDLDKARQQAVRTLEQLNQQVVDDAQSVEQAEINLIKAKKALAQTNASETSTPLERRQAQLDYEVAVNSLQKLKKQREENAQSAADANTKGVEGSDEVVAAKDRVTQANERVTESEAELAQTQRDSAAEIARAQADLAQAQADSAADIQDAQRRLAEAQEDQAREVAEAQAELAQTQKDAAKDVKEAEERLARARRDAAQQVQDAARSLQRAQRDLTEAQKEGADAGTKAAGAQSAYAKALQALSPAGRSFVAFLLGEWIPAWRKVKAATQEALLPPVEQGLRAVLPLLDVLKVGFVGAATIIGGTFRDLATRYLATPLFQSQFRTILDSNNRALETMAQAVIPVTRAVTDLTVATGPLVERFAAKVRDAAVEVSNVISGKAVGGRNSELAQFFSDAADRADQLWRITKNVFVALFNVGRAAQDAGDRLLGSLESATQRWREFTGSTEGQNKLRAYFDQAAPTVEAFGRLLGATAGGLAKLGTSADFAALLDQIRTQLGPAIMDLGTQINQSFGPALIRAVTAVVQLLADLGNNGAGTVLTAMANSITAIATAFSALVKVPGVGEFLGFLGTLIGFVIPLGLVASAFLKLVSPLISIVSWVLRSQAAMAVLRAAFAALTGPVGIVIGIIALVIGALVTLYRTNDGFRAFVNEAWNSIKGWISQAWENGIKPALEAFGRFVTETLWPAIQAFWQEGVVPAWNGIVAVLAWAWGSVIQPTLAAFATFLRDTVGPAVTWLWNEVVVPAWNAISSAISTAWTGTIKPTLDVLVAFFRSTLAPIFTWLWENVVRPAFLSIKDWIELEVKAVRVVLDALEAFLRNVVGPVIVWLYENVVKPQFEAIGKIIEFVWNNAIKPSFDALKLGLTAVEDAFDLAVKAITKIWDGLKKAASDPVKFVVDTVYNNGIRVVWNKVAGLVGLNQLDPVSVSFATGGVVPGYEPGRDTVHAMLSKGEGIIVPEAVRGIAARMGTTATNAIASINAAFASRVPRPAAAAGGVPRFADGGIVGDAASWVLGGIKTAASAAFSPLLDSISSRLVGNQWASALGSMAKKLIAGALDLFGTKESEALAKLMAEGMGWQRQWDIIKAQFPGAQLLSSVRPGSITSSGNVSYHAMGRAIDITPSMEIFNWLVENYGTTSREIIFTPAGSRQIKDGKPYLYSGEVADEHWNHVHWAYDRGGYLQPGVTVTQNDTGEPEPVFTGRQWDTLSRLVAVGAGATAQQSTAVAGPAGRRELPPINIYSQPGQDIYELARAVAVEIGWMVRG